jgi:type VI secretion system protein ImpJ
MNDIVNAHLPGVGLNHIPTPPSQIRAVADHVYFLLDKNSPLWPEFSTANAIGLHFSGDWPELQLDLWAILGDRR